MTAQYAWIKTGDGREVYRRVREPAPARSGLPCPQIITDEMPPTEQVDGKFYTSKSAYRAVGRANGLIEVGNEKFKPRKRIEPDGKAIDEAISRALAKRSRGSR